MKKINILGIIFLILITSCSQAKRIECRKCKAFNKYVKTTWIYDTEKGVAYINSTVDQYGVKKTFDFVRANLKCWEGKKVNRLEKILPFPKDGTSFRRDWFHLIPAKECFQCGVRKENCDNPILDKFDCYLTGIIIEFTAKDKVKEVNLKLRPKYYALEIK